MVTFAPQGRLGNFLLEAATAYSYALKHGLQYSSPTKSTSEIWNPLYLQHLVNPDFNPSLPEMLIDEKQHNFKELPFDESWRNLNIKIRGYFQSELYFKEHRQEILEAFRFKWEMIPNVVSIHIRRGDYVELPTKHPVVTNEFISKAFALFAEKGYKTFWVFSDGIEWCRANINTDVYPDYNFEYKGRGDGGRTEWENMELGSCCEHNIVSNGTFGWWQGWLNRNPNKIVVTPHEDNHFGFNNKHNDVSDYTPKDWKRIKYTPIYDLPIEEQNKLNNLHK